VATNNSENLQRVEVTAPEARSQIKIIWTSPLIPLDPIVWRKDLDPAVKTKLYSFLLSYGRIGSDDEIAAAKAILANLVWSTFQPSSDHQLIPIRLLEANKTLMRVQGDDKLSADEKSSQIAAIRADIAKLEEMQKKADSDEFHSRAAAFLEADKAGRQDELKKMIAEFAAGAATTHRHDRGHGSAGLTPDASRALGGRPPSGRCDVASSRASELGARGIGRDRDARARRNRSRSRRDRRSLVSARAPHPRLARLGRGFRVAGVGVGAGGNVPRRRPVHGLAQHGAVRRRVSQAEFFTSGTSTSPTWS